MKLIFTLIILIFLVTFSVSTEVIYLNNGNTINGKILEDTDAKITIMTDAGKLTLPKNIVAKVESSSDSLNLKLEAETCIAQKDIPTAIAKYDEYLKQNSNDETAKQKRSELVNNLITNLCVNAENLLSSNEFEKAITEYENVLASQQAPITKELINQRLSIAYSKLAHQQFDTVKFNAAKDSCQKAINYDNTNIDSKKLLAKIYLKENNSQLALPLLEEVVQMAPEDELKLDLAECYLDCEDDEKAYPLLENLKDSINVDNKLVREMLKDIHYNRYLSLSEENKHNEALEEYLKYFDYSLKNSEIYEECANVYKNAGMSDKYIELIKMAEDAKLKETRIAQDPKQKIIIRSSSAEKTDSSDTDVKYSRVKTKRKGVSSRSGASGKSGSSGSSGSG